MTAEVDPIIEAALDAWRRGLRPVVVRRGAKAPMHADWNKVVYTDEATIRHDFRDADKNLGIQFGVEHVDCDLENATVVAAAETLLPPTEFAWGRPGNPHSHRVYRIDGDGAAIKRRQYKAPDKALLAELRGENCQSVVPPSQHPDGEAYEWTGEPFGGEAGAAVATVDELDAALRDVTMVAVLADLWQGCGARHDAALGVAALLVKAGRSEERADEMMTALCDLAGDDELDDRLTGVKDTYTRAAGGEVIACFERLCDCFDEPVAKWLLKVFQQPVDAEQKTVGDRSWNDVGNAKWFVAQHGDDMLWIGAHKRWHAWDAKRWNGEATLEERRRAHATFRTMREYIPALPSPAQRAAFLEHILRSENARKIDGMLTEAKALLYASATAFDSDVNLLNLDNGTLDLQTMAFRDAERGDYITKITPVCYAPQATCPKWTAFIDKITAGDAALARYLQKIAGYAMTGSTQEQCFFFLYGGGKNGKSTYVETVAKVLGDYAMKTPVETLLAKKSEGGAVRNDVARLAGARMVTSMETEDGRRLAEALIKDLTGGDRISARFLYGEYFDFRPQFKLFLYGNHKPTVRGTDEGIWRRIKLVPFTVEIPEAERIDDYGDVLYAEEAAGILNWMIDGCRLWRAEGLIDPDAVVKGTADYRTAMDVVGEFVEDRCDLGGASRVEMQQLYEAYRDWTLATGEFAMTQRQLGMKLVDRGLTKKKSNGRWFWLGLSLRSA